MANATSISKNKKMNNAKYNDKCQRKTVIFRPQDASLYLRLSEIEKGQLSELVRDLLKKHFDKIDDTNNND